MITALVKNDEMGLATDLTHVRAVLDKNSKSTADHKIMKIGLLDHMGYGNMGDAAIQEAFISNIRKRLPAALLVGFSLYPDDTRKRHEIVTYPIQWCYPGWKGSEAPAAHGLDQQTSLKSFLKRCRIVYALAKHVNDCVREIIHLVRSFRVVRSLDLLVMSGGGQLCDLHRGLPYNVFKFCVLAKLSKTPVFIVGVGADLLERRLNRFFAKWSVRLAKYVSFRSIESQALIRELGVRRETHTCPDPAYAINIRDYLASKRSDTLTVVESQALFRSLGYAFEPREAPTRAASTLTYKVGLNPIGFCDPRRWPRKDDAAYRLYLDKLEALSLGILAQNFELEIFTSDIIVDVYAIEDLEKRLLKSAPSSSVVVRPVLTLKELLLQMSTFDFIVTSKFHGVVFSHLLGKPVIALSYLPKIENLMRTAGHERYCLDIAQFEVNVVLDKFRSLVDEKDLLRSLFLKTSASYASALQGHFDNLFSAETSHANTLSR